MGLIDGFWNRLLGDPKKPGGNKPHVRAAARDGAAGKRTTPAKAKTKTKGREPRGEQLPRPVKDARTEAVEVMRANQARVMTPEREKLIGDAMAVHRAKQKILADLSDEERRKLMVMAMRALLNEGKEPDK